MNETKLVVATSVIIQTEMKRNLTFAYKNGQDRHHDIRTAGILMMLE